MPGEEEKKKRLAEAQARECASVLERAFSAVFTSRQALDRFLAETFRNSPKYGSKDRRRIGDALFRVFRDFGFLCLLLKEGERTAEKCLLLSSVLAGEKEYPDCFLAPFALPAERFREAAERLSVPGRVQSLSLLLERSSDEKKAFSLTDNLPSWVLPHFPDRTSAEDTANALPERSPVWFRSNFPGEEKKTERIVQDFGKAGIGLVFHAFKKDAFRLPEGKRILLQDLASFREGLFEVQDLSSQCIGQACFFPKREEENSARIFDCCAGGGGKTLQMAAFLRSQGKKGHVYAWDTRKNKLEETFRRGKKGGFSNITVLEEFPAGETFDKVLVDAPCSGSGRWRRAPEQRFLLTEEELSRLKETQLEILERAASCVKEGGVLSYGTCSVFRDENRETAEKFLTLHPEFALESFPSPLTGEECSGMLAILPSHGNCDGAFAARFRKKS